MLLIIEGLMMIKRFNQKLKVGRGEKFSSPYLPYVTASAGQMCFYHLFPDCSSPITCVPLGIDSQNIPRM
jgi:hypothetical protein